MFFVPNLGVMADSRPGGGSKAAALLNEACGELGAEGKQACARAAAAGKVVVGQACDQATTGGKACAKAAGAGGLACIKAAATLKADLAKANAALQSWWRSLAPSQPAEGSSSTAPPNAGDAAVAAQSSGDDSSGVAPAPAQPPMAQHAGKQTCETAAAAVGRACGQPGCVQLGQCGKRACGHVAVAGG